MLKITKQNYHNNNKVRNKKSNIYLKRGKGKTTGDIHKYDFFKHYKKKAKNAKLERKEYDAFLKELLSTFSRTIVKENMQLKLGPLGYLRVKANKLHFFKKNGEKSKSLKVDWPTTWKMWEKTYEGKTRDEITELKGKKVVYFMNDHTNQEFYQHYWDRLTSSVKYHRFYEFTPSRQYSRLINTVVKDPNRKIYYYG